MIQEVNIVMLGKAKLFSMAVANLKDLILKPSILVLIQGKAMTQRVD